MKERREKEMQYNYAVLWLTSQDDNAILIAIGELEGGIVHTPLSASCTTVMRLSPDACSRVACNENTKYKDSDVHVD